MTCADPKQYIKKLPLPTVLHFATQQHAGFEERFKRIKIFFKLEKI